MFSTLLTVALFVAPAIQGVFADFAINSPDLVQCQPSKISWAATKGPYNLIVVPASDPCGDPLATIGDFDTTFTSWTTTIAAGTQVVLSALDADDNEAWSKTITVGASSDASCLSSSPAAGASTPAATTPDSGDSSTPSGGSVAPVGAANAGTNPLSAVNGAINARQASTPLLAIAGLVAVLSLL